MKSIQSSKVFDLRINPKMKLSAEALMIISEVSDEPTFEEADIARLIEGVTNQATLKLIWKRLRSKGGDSTGEPQAFFEKLGFRADRLTHRETANLKILLGKYVKPKLDELEAEKIELAQQIDRLAGMVTGMDKGSENGRKMIKGAKQNE